MPEGLDLSVDRTSEVALGTQLIWKLRALIARGALPPGAKLPGIREVAETAAVNVNTVRSVFARLEEQGLLVSEHGRGTFVAAGARLDAKLAEATELVIATARESGIDPQELAAALYVSPKVAASPLSSHSESDVISPTVPAADGRSERRELYREIEALESEIGRLDPLGALEQRPPAETQPRMLATAELRHVRDDLVVRVDQLRRERQEWRDETDRLEAARHESVARGGDHPWRAGIWTGTAGAAVSWTRA
jgi:DNA-binding transcriptional regulator YhcF (GntR family)